MVKRYFFTIAFLGWMVFVTFSSLYSFEGVHVSRFNIPHTDKIVHFTFYFIACVLGLFFLRERTTGTIKLTKALGIMIMVTVVFGAVIEVLQYNFTTARTGDIFDGIANTAGSLCGAIAVKSFFSSKRQLKWKF